MFASFACQGAFRFEGLKHLKASLEGALSSPTYSLGIAQKEHDELKFARGCMVHHGKAEKDRCSMLV